MLQQPRVRAELAVEHADVGRLYMKVAVEVSMVSMLFLANIVRQRANKAQLSFFKKKHAFIEGDALVVVNLFLECHKNEKQSQKKQQEGGEG